MKSLQKNPVKIAIQEKKLSFGCYIATPSPAIVELAGVAGLDWIRIDWAHSALDLPIIENMIRAAESQDIAPFIRLNLDEQKISSVLEIGALGIIVPDVETAEDAKAIVNAAKFSPIGERGMFSAPRKSHYGLISGGDFKEWSNKEILIGVQIENLKAVENLEEILEVTGIDMVLSGRGDLSNALGFPGQKDHPKVLETEEKIFRIAKSKGIAISPQIDPTAADFQIKVSGWIKKEAYVISFGHDLPIIKKTFENLIHTALETKKLEL